MNIEEKIKLASANEHIPLVNIEEDLIDTKIELRQMKKELKNFRIGGDRMRQLKLSNLKNGIKEREEFVIQLLAILEVRRGVIEDSFI